MKIWDILLYYGQLFNSELQMNKPPVKICLLPGGNMPEMKTSGAIGFDVSIRAVVSPMEMDLSNPLLRKTLFDFKNIPADNPYVERHVTIVPGENGNELAYEMDPNESVLVGIGFKTEMKWPMFYWVAPRSGLAAKWGITVTNAPGTVDLDYRGEAGVLVFNRNEHPFLLKHGMRIAQVIFQKAIIPRLVLLSSEDVMSSTERGVQGFGSTGIR